jgi:hypothetical protein
MTASALLISLLAVRRDTNYSFEDWRLLKLYMEISPYLWQYRIRFHYKDQSVNFIWEKKNIVYCETRTTHINTFCEQNIVEC